MIPIRGLYALCDNSTNPRRSHREIAEALLRGGARILQLRMKGEPDRARVLGAARDILDLKDRYEFLFILNDFAELAGELGVDGVHIGRDDPSIAETRRCVGADRLVGYSSHSLQEALEAQSQGADYVAFGAIYPTRNKGPGHPIQGLEKLSTVVKTLRVPVVAIGGIGRENFKQVLATGVAAVAMIGAMAGAEDIESETKHFVNQYSSLPIRGVNDNF